METGNAIDILIQAEVIQPGADGDDLQLTSAFTERQEVLTGESDGERQSLEAVPIEDEALATYLRTSGNNEFLAKLHVLSECLDEFDDGQLIHLARIAEHFERGLPRAEGVPQNFFPVHGDQLAFYLGMHEYALVYVWLDDCEPCDEMQDSLERTFRDESQNIELFSVYGPEWMDTLYQQYDVYAGPTTLFVRNGVVDARLLDAYPESVIRNEIKELQRDRTNPDASG